MENDEVIIDLRVLMWEILRKWHIVLISCIVFAVLAGAFGMHKHKKENAEVSVEDLSKGLTPAEITKVNNLVSVQKRINEKTEYEKESVYMSLNPYDVDMARTDFMLNKNIDNKYIRQMYVAYMFDGGLFNEIAEEYPGDIDAENLAELIGFVNVGGRVNLNDDSEANFEKGDDLNRILSVRIYGKDKAQCEELQALVVKHVKLYEKEVQKKYNSHSLEEISSSVYKTVDTGMASVKSTYDAQIVALYNEYQVLYNALTETQTALFEKITSTDAEIAENGTAGSEPETEETGTGSGISLKYIIVGILAGGFISVVAIVLLTMSNGRIFVQRQITDKGL